MHKEEEEEAAKEIQENSDTNDKIDLDGHLETIIKFGLNYRSVSQQTWQVVEHPSMYVENLISFIVALAVNYECTTSRLQNCFLMFTL